MQCACSDTHETRGVVIPVRLCITIGLHDWIGLNDLVFQGANLLPMGKTQGRSRGERFTQEGKWGGKKEHTFGEYRISGAFRIMAALLFLPGGCP